MGPITNALIYVYIYMVIWLCILKDMTQTLTCHLKGLTSEFHPPGYVVILHVGY